MVRARPMRSLSQPVAPKQIGPSAPKKHKLRNNIDDNTSSAVEKEQI